MHTPRLSFVLMLALVSTLGACSRRQPAPQTMSPEARKVAEAAQREIEALPRKLAALPPECTLGSARQVRGTWVTTEHAETKSAQPSTTVFSFDAPVMTTAFRVALNPDGFRALDKIEMRDADGNWRPAWTGDQTDAPAACEYVLLQQGLDGSPRRVRALRFSFRAGPSQITAAAVSVLQQTPQAPGT